MKTQLLPLLVCLTGGAAFAQSTSAIAYEYGTFNLSFDSLPDNKHIDHEGAYIRTWRKEKGQWLADIAFMRPFGNMTLVAETDTKK
ncbi:hypothetical protein [Fibrella aquatilis]|uniref:Uncharacterized protein n=1 Tax=Fibrella aquatilis TaxID=2817059 RepID=A0A939JYM8_9BACT|nr:hypothetical protein [Fibrella aquatilis]MBO0930026.1 hypothetical protein [Fibrella aquatilis]